MNAAREKKIAQERFGLCRSTDPIRIALYSPGIVGLGHMRRNLLIGQTLTSSALNASVLMIAEAHQLGAFTMPTGMDCVTLPAYRKDSDGCCGARYLNMPLDELIELRSQVICSTLKAFQPDVLIVDNLPRGALRELDVTLKYLEMGQTRCVLGLRDILDDPDVVRREWDTAGNLDIIRRSYDAVWVYGDRQIYDQVSQYNYPDDIATKASYVGYLDQRTRLDFTENTFADPLDGLGLPPGQFALCLVGGGQDGEALAEAFAAADLPPDMNAVILTGPFMPAPVRQRLRHRELLNPRLRVLEFISEPTLLLQRASRVVAMGGYNTVSEILCFGKPSLIIPRVKPRREQIIRAECLQKLNLLDVLHPDGLSSYAISAWLAQDVSPPQVCGKIDIYGLDRIPHLIEDLIKAPFKAAAAA